jgi:serine/threonine protein kinase
MRLVMMGRYQMDMSKDGLLGEGTSCICRKGRDVQTGVLVAIKVYKAVGSEEVEVCLTKYRRSIAVLKKLQEPFQRPSDSKLWTSQLEYAKPSQLFMPLLDYSKDAKGEPCCDACDGKLYLVTELAQQSLKDFVDNRKKEAAPPSKETVRSITKAIILVMAGLHAKGLVHMDVKPENLMIFDGRLKLIDVDGCVDIGTRISLNDSSISFSPIYCAPEWASFLLGDEDASISAAPGLDTWSIGCTICELVTLDAVMRPTYAKMARRHRREGPAVFMDWLKSLKEAPLPQEVKQFDIELAQLMTGCLLVCNTTERRSCAESLDTPYLASDKLQRTKSSPIKLQVHEKLMEQEVEDPKP